jgi:type II secretory pathway pseudopilin PulG
LKQEYKTISLLTLTSVTVIAGYFFLRYAYKVTDTTPFTQEIVLIILGTVATILITALLLNQQTAVDIKKEQNIKFLDLKTKTYEELIQKIENITISMKVTDSDLVNLQFLTHRLAIFSSPQVLKEYHNFLESLNYVAHDRKISIKDSIIISEGLANLTTQIRADLLGEADLLGDYSQNEIKKLILKNSSESMELSREIA